MLMAMLCRGWEFYVGCHMENPLHPASLSASVSHRQVISTQALILSFRLPLFLLQTHSFSSPSIHIYPFPIVTVHVRAYVPACVPMCLSFKPEIWFPLGIFLIPPFNFPPENFGKGRVLLTVWKRHVVHLTKPLLWWFLYKFCYFSCYSSAFGLFPCLKGHNMSTRSSSNCLPINTYTIAMLATQCFSPSCS